MLFPKKISYKCVLLRNVIVQYKCTVTNSFKQDRASQAQFENITSLQMAVVTDLLTYAPPRRERPANQPDVKACRGNSSISPMPGCGPNALPKNRI